LIKKGFGYVICNESKPLLDITLWDCYEDYEFTTKELMRGYKVIKKVEKKKATIIIAKKGNCLYYEIISKLGGEKI